MATKITRPSNNHVYKRKEMLVNPKIQWTLMATYLVSILIVIGVCYGSALRLVEGVRETVLTEGPSPILDQLKDDLILTLAVTSAILITGVGTWILIVSHRIAGPIYGLVRVLQDLAQGKEGRRVHFRKGDFFPDLEKSFNQFYDRYQQLRFPSGQPTPSSAEAAPPPPPGGNTPPPPPAEATRTGIKTNTKIKMP